MDIHIREYFENDYEYLQNFLVKLNQYIMSFDPDKKIYTTKDYKDVYTNELLKLTKENDGIIYIAEANNYCVGMIAGIIEKYSIVDNTHYKNNKEGRILELFVEENYRKENIGKKLMEKIEEYFKENGCDFLLVDVFEYNKVAKEFYRKSGYNARNIEMCKKI
ncbi:MAG: GNAT family N-acetyltransferase [Treponema sp.]|jgi:ribosomal protein S18 acetylase RimI-like enzyme|nr:GNAT family N-acetyltransferase [Treponema sp.]